MITIADALRTLRSRLELSDREQQDASRRQKEIRSYLDCCFDIEHDFLTGSYARWTKTKPLKDVDIFCVLGEKERHYRDSLPSEVLGAVRDVLADKYGANRVSCQRRSVTVDFGVQAVDDETDGKVMSFDVVPAFSLEDYYDIPDTITADWVKTNPRVHYDKAVEAQRAYSGEWKGLVRMMKKWNSQQGKPIKPSFLIEVMALEVLYGGFQGDFRYEMKSFFASLADRIHDEWPDPAGLGPAVSDSMDYSQREKAKAALLNAQYAAAQAIQLEKSGKNGEALRAWRDLFGPLFPLS
ncbi:MAG: nucleotidyltransferase [Armatimonadetes bacterium]|nr:nucleotidyltransferase [Armatimonadota bacterium]